MKLTFISDTHSLHDRMPPLGSGDVLVHCGDFTGRGDLNDTQDFARFMAVQDFTHKIVIAGNHDWCFENELRDEAEACLRDHGLIYLNDSGVEIDGMKFWGSPVQPEFCDWAFNRKRGEDIRYHWDKIPNGIDVLITHGPARGILDRCENGYPAGCDDLLDVVQRIKPRILACGHIHEAYGVLEVDGTIFINACILDERYRVRNPPVEVEL
ncbi:metallophosphatase domain-containing protein [Thiothrix nivea]|uniref:Metallophosphoesterase n=1 Tax=Thiothrix nivea (strain ATCC 35100 / DSM 5205 / JP2) TaxID=870187 RepID=A0A656HEM2_THINJ|nr:metallophosphatase domain-containing protein [Thiothrix nivea]EIJ35368.1 metallophosphoesterase [Thiothrix nivea DSM 5205]